MSGVVTVESRSVRRAGPIRADDYGPLDALSVLIALLMGLASSGGLFVSGLYRDNVWSTAAFRGTDLSTLLFAVPTLLTALWLARRGSQRARLVWLGVLAYNVYNYAFYLFGAAFNDFFLLYTAIMGLSLHGLVWAVPRVLDISVSPLTRWSRAVGGYLVVVGGMFAALWIVDCLRFVLTDELPEILATSGISTSIVYALDLTLIVPALLIGGVLLWRRRPLGVLIGVPMNVLALLYMVSLAFAGAFQADAGIGGAAWSTPPYVELAGTSAVAAWLLLCSIRSTLPPRVGAVVVGSPGRYGRSRSLRRRPF